MKVRSKLESIAEKIGLDGVSFLIILFSLIARLAWIAYTNYTFEDAFITFRYAQRLHDGFGFEYNLGQRTYGTTTPFFTFLGTGWLVISKNLIFGSRFISLISSTGVQYFLFRGLKALQRSKTQLYAVLILVGLWPTLIKWDTGGMEIPVVLFLITASWYAFIREKASWVGLLTGLLLLTRIDTFLWSLILIALRAKQKPKQALVHVSLNTLIYLPWLVFAQVYFGSAIPLTILAKWYAYSIPRQSGVIDQLTKVFKRLGPATFGLQSPPTQQMLLVIAGIILALAFFQILKKGQHRMILIIFIFAVLEVFRLAITKATFTTRYAVPLIFALLVLAGLTIGEILDNLPKFRLPGKAATVGLCLILLCTIIYFGLREAHTAKDVQTNRHESALKAVGVWLNQNTPPNARIQLEPLGYAGYYSDRTMLDVVGLVTPQVIQMKQAGLTSPESYVSELTPDYIVLHCDDALAWIQNNETSSLQRFSRVKSFNPLEFDPTIPLEYHSIPAQLARSACYEIWGRNEIED